MTIANRAALTVALLLSSPPAGAGTDPDPASEDVAPSPVEALPRAEPAAPASAGVPAAPSAAPLAVAKDSGTERLAIGGGAVFWYYQPLQGSTKNNVDLFYANLTLDAKAGELGLHVEPRLRGTKLRPFFDGPAWIEEAYVRAVLGPVVLKLGKVYKQLGLFWDDSFYGSILVYDGLKLIPDYGVSAEGAVQLDGATGVRYFAQFFVVDGRTNVSLPGRDTISIAGARRRNEAVARIEPFRRLTADLLVKLGASGEYLQADLPEGKQNVFHVGGDATVEFARFRAWAEYLRQNGRSVDGFPIAPIAASETMPAVPGQASGHNNYVLAGASYSFGPVTARYNFSWVQYADLDISETLHEPALDWAVSSNLRVLAEVVRWHRKAPTGSSTVDDSLNVTLHGHF